ncbi:MAG TPA: ATP-grasp domain-containing protein [Tenuifilaceae bacterium]|nr:ATP-grasp domain-containing protein [Tenuifilaceae bacterium]HPN22047.1 ATP-grasp domain-containing protein [Tenuifilaceae bacterium]HPV56341.1 ATP-grasp domain-containing protein [Tenuifilaceae bacterium]HSA04087.1 ATP-grasp domain-containing protein [Tenuifilaceae bacterium]
MARTKITVAVTGLNNIDSPGPGIPVIRGIKESEEFDARIIGLAYEHLEPGIYMSELVDKTYMIPYPSKGKEALYDRLMEIHKKENIDVIIPNFDAELFSFIKLENQLNKVGIKTFLPTLEQFEERHKSNLPAYGKKYGVDIPQGTEVFSIADLNNALKSMEYPVMVKGKYYDAYKAYSEEQAIAYFHKMSAKWGLPVILQEFIDGTEVNVIALGDGKGNLTAAVPMRKQYITDKGKAWGGITIEDQSLLDLAHKIVSQSKWRGGMELELIRSANGKLYILEINPRIPAWVYLAVGAGQNIPEALIKLALGNDVKPYTRYDVGKMFIRYSYDMIVDIDRFSTLATSGEL